LIFAFLNNTFLVPPNVGPVEYLMKGVLPDVSAKSFLHSNIDYDCRKKWDMVINLITFIYVYI